MLFEARPVGQSRLTKEQSFMLRTNSALSRIQKNGQLVRKLSKAQSKSSASSTLKLSQVSAIKATKSTSVPPKVP